MKTNVIQLEGHDEITSACNKITAGKVGRVLLVWSPRKSSLSRKLDIVLLKRLALKQGIILGLVVKNEKIQAFADEVGLPWFNSVEDAQAKAWHRSRHPGRLGINLIPERSAGIYDFPQQRWRPLRERSYVRITAFIFGLLAIFALVLFFLPSAKIFVNQSHSQQSVVIDLWAGTAITSPGLSGGVPVHIAEVVVEGKDQLASSGESLVADAVASGRVRFTNLTDADILIPEGSIISTQTEPVVKVMTIGNPRVPGGVGNYIDVHARAVEGGTAGNVPAGSITAIQGPIGLSLMVENPQSFSGGTDRLAHLPTEGDYQLLYVRLAETLRKRATEKIQEQAGQGTLVLSDSVELDQVLAEERNPPSGQSGDVLVIQMQVAYTGWYVLQDDLLQVARSSLNAGIPPESQPVSDTVSYTTITEPKKQGDIYRWQILAVRDIQSGLDNTALCLAVLGQTKSQAENTVQKLLSMEVTPRIQLSPPWWPRLPYLPLRIQVIRP